MFGMGIPGWGWNWGWGWGWAAAIGGLIILGIFLLPWFFFLLNLQTTLNRVSDRNRAMPAGYVWLNFIPVFNLGWFIYTVIKVRDSLRAEYESRGWPTEGDFGYNVGLAAGILAIVAFVMGWVPVLGWGVAVAEIICWIVYWVRTAEFKNQLAAQGAWQGPAPKYGYPGPTPPPWGSGGGPYQAGPPAAPYQAGPTGPQTAPYQPPPGEPAAPSAEAAPAEAGPTAEAAPVAEAAVTQCAGCGVAFDPSDRFCRSCGLPLPGRRA